MWIKSIFLISLADAEKALNTGELQMSVLHSKSLTSWKKINQINPFHDL